MISGLGDSSVATFSTPKPVPSSNGRLPAISHEVADFVLAASWDGLPRDVQKEVVRTNLNWVACAVGGANTPTAEVAIRAVLGMGSQGSTPVLGRSERFDMVNAAFLSCLNSAAQAFDDTHLKTITHPTGPVAAAAMAAIHALATQGKPSSGKDFLLALALGIEIECRLSNAIKADGAGADLGWYMTGVSGGIGAAVAVGRLLKLDHGQLVSAIGLAAAQACGVRSTHGSMATAYVPAIAARNGLTAAYMAAAGFTCSDGSIDGRNGLLQVMSPNADVERIRSGLGIEFELLNNAYKPYPCGIVIHPAIDAALALLANLAVSKEAIERVDLRVHPDALNLTWRKLPDTVLDAQVSLYHWVAAALVNGSAEIGQSELPCIQDSEVRAMQEKIFPVADTLLASDQAEASVRLNNGQVFQIRIEHASGSIANPMNNEQLEAKFRSLTRRVLSEKQVDLLLQACWNMDAAQDPLEVFRLGSL